MTAGIPIKPDYDQVKFNPGKAAYQMFINALNGDFGDVIDSCFKGFSIDTRLEQLAFSLVTTSLGKACRMVYEKDEGLNKVVSQDDFAGQFKFLAEALDGLFRENDYTLNSDFFQHPSTQDYVTDGGRVFGEWLEENLDLSPERSRAVVPQIGGFFCKALVDEWEARKMHYSRISDHFKNPFFEAFEVQAALENYQAEILSQYGKGVFGDPKMGLPDIYVEPDFQVSNHCKKEKTTEYNRESEGFDDTEYPGSLHQYLPEWLQGSRTLDIAAEKSRLLLLLGQPGQGKSSFCYRTFFQIAEKQKGKAVFFLRLRDCKIKDTQSWSVEPLVFFREELRRVYFPEQIKLDKKRFENAFLILDGLDELSMKSGLTNDDLDYLLKNLRDDISRYPGLRVLVTTRYNYVNLSKIPVESTLILKLKEFTWAKQSDWLDKYGRFYPECRLVKEKDKLEAINNSKDAKDKDLQNLLNQPILLQLLAAADFVPDASSNKSRIYDKLFEAVIGRKKKEGLTKYENLEPEDMRQFLRVVAWQIFQSDHEYLKRSDFEAQDSELFKAGEKIRKKMAVGGKWEDFIKELLVSFYFKNTPKNQADHQEEDREGYALEFYHKSLYEFLAAEHAWLEMKRFFLEKDGWENDEFRIKDDKDVLPVIFAFFSGKIFSAEVAGYFRETIRNDGLPPRMQEGTEWKRILFERLRDFLPYLLDHDFLYEYRAGSKNGMPLDAALATFYAYLTLISALVEEVELPGALDADYERAFKKAQEIWNFIPENEERARKNRRNRIVNLLVLLRRDYFDRAINLVHTDLSGAYLPGVDLRGADLSGADLPGVDLRGAYLRGAYLHGAYLSGADLRSADLSVAYLIHADLIIADLRGADLRSVDLSVANLNSANLSNANLRGADLVRADLVRANLSNANLRGANLRGANLRGANLRGANLSNAGLSNANFEDAVMEGVTGLETAKNKHLADFKGTGFEGKFEASEEEE